MSQYIIQYIIYQIVVQNYFSILHCKHNDLSLIKRREIQPFRHGLRLNIRLLYHIYDILYNISLNDINSYCIFDQPWDIAVGVFTIIGQTPKEVTLVPNESKAVSDSRAGRRASPGSFGLQLFPQPATSLSHITLKSRPGNYLHNNGCQKHTWKDNIT